MAAVATAAVAILPGTGSGPTAKLRPVSAVEVLGRAADTARAEDLHARNDQFIEVTSVEITRGRRYDRRLWESVDGTRVGLLRTSPCQFDDAKATCDVPLANGDRLKGAPPTPFEGTPAFLRTLPTEPAALQAYIRAHVGKDAVAAGKTTVEEGTWKFVVDHSGESYVPPKLRGALFDVAAKLRGISVTRNVRDAIGRPGIAITRETGPSRDELIFDPVGYRFLGERLSTAQGETYQSAVVSTKVADALPPHHYLPERRHN